jgi:hypothetical protein
MAENNWTFSPTQHYDPVSQQFNGEPYKYSHLYPSPSPNIPLAQNTAATSAARRSHRQNPNNLNMRMPPRTPDRRARELYAAMMESYVSPIRNTRVPGLTPNRSSAAAGSSSSSSSSSSGAGSSAAYQPPRDNINISGNGTSHNLSEEQIRAILQHLNEENARRRTVRRSRANANLEVFAVPAPKKPPTRTYESGKLPFGRPPVGKPPNGKKGGTRRRLRRR